VQHSWTTYYAKHSISSNVHLEKLGPKSRLWLCDACPLALKDQFTLIEQSVDLVEQLYHLNFNRLYTPTAILDVTAICLASYPELNPKSL